MQVEKLKEILQSEKDQRKLIVAVGQLVLYFLDGIEKQNVRIDKLEKDKKPKK